MATDETRGTIPPDHWLPHPVSDHGDLDRPDPAYADSLTGDAKAEYDAAVAARKKATPAPTPPPTKPKSRRSRKRKAQS